jgi:squalene-hopene/tetraprenyl-beta-curcumene cyclase
MTRNSFATIFVVGFTIALLIPQPLSAADAAAKYDQARYEKMVARAIQFLESSRHPAEGSYSSFAGIGPTALVTTALLRHGRSPDDPFVATSLKYLEGHVQPNGSICMEGTLYRNYETCVCIMCFQEANADGRYDEIIAKADAFIKGLQWDDSEGIDESDLRYGGGGYGKHRRPDMSNTSYLIDALKAAGNGADDQAVRRALIFVSRCQNLETEHNTTPFAARNPDGGFYYTCAAGGETKAEVTAAGGLRSYGSMTYAGLKSMLYAGVAPDDPRVVAAKGWVQKHYTLEENPGIGPAGLYYYYHTFAKALAAVGDDQFVDATGTERHWRRDLVDALAQRQQDNGAWVNESTKWLEGDPNLVTAYALLALSYVPQEESTTGQ